MSPGYQKEDKFNQIIYAVFYVKTQSTYHECNESSSNIKASKGFQILHQDCGHTLYTVETKMRQKTFKISLSHSFCMREKIW